MRIATGAAAAADAAAADAFAADAAAAVDAAAALVAAAAAAAAVVDGDEFDDTDGGGDCAAHARAQGSAGGSFTTMEKGAKVTLMSLAATLGPT